MRPLDNRGWLKAMERHITSITVDTYNYSLSVKWSDGIVESHPVREMDVTSILYDKACFEPPLELRQPVKGAKYEVHSAKGITKHTID